jgi:hypothetical protein
MLRKYLPLALLILLALIVVITNFSISKFILGWDNLIPELNFPVNFSRSIFSVWQEYQGLGLLAGNGHAAELPREILLLISSFILPLNLIRQFYVFSMLITGVLGTYFLIKLLLPTKNNIFAFIGGTFYLLNLATIQTFFVPFEPMITHYGLLPWLVLTLVYYLKNHSHKALLGLAIVNILATPQAEVPTMFLVYLIVAAFVLFAYNLKERTKYIFKKSLKALAIIFIINAFWLLPFLYFVLTNSSVAIDAKINQMSTENVILQNKAFGNILDVMLLKGFWFNNVDPNLNAKFTYMLTPWKNYFSNIIISILGYIFFGVILIGLWKLIKSKKPAFISLALLFGFSFTMLCMDTPPFSWIDNILRMLPIFNQVFRFPFTKFSNIALLTYAIFFAGGILYIHDYFENRLKTNKIPQYLTITVCFAMLIIYVLPIFNNLFYYKDKLIIPNEYFKVMDYFNKQDPNARIANLPQYTFWGWSYYKWGYGGSGFLWYGIKQPILDRAFDVWSKTNENYYWELAHAIYSKNPTLLSTVLNKYQIKFILIDNNIINPSSSKSLFLPEIKNLISQIPEIKEDASFGNIEIYKVQLKSEPNKFIFTANKLHTINNYQWGEYDKAYIDIGNYISADKNVDYYYPFRSVFSGKTQENLEFKTSETPTDLEISQDLTYINPDAKLHIPSFLSLEKLTYTGIIQYRNNDNLIIGLNLKTPQIYISQKDKTGKIQKIKIWGKELIKPIFIVKNKNNYGYYINVNGVKSFKVEPFIFEGQIGSTFLSTTQDNIIVLSNTSLHFAQTYTLSRKDLNNLIPDNQVINLPNLTTNSKLMIEIPKINDDYQNFIFTPSKTTTKTIKNCDNFNKGPLNKALIENAKEKFLELSSINSTACVSLYSSKLSHDQGYATFIDSQNLQGRPFHFWILNENEKYSPIDTYLSGGSDIKTDTFILSPQEPYGTAYSFHFDNISITHDQTVNRLGQIRVYPLPYYFVTSMFISTNIENFKSNPENNITVDHPNESQFVVQINPSMSKTDTLVLSQSFNEGWTAYVTKKSGGITEFINKTLPFFFGTRIKQHVLINNWENGWIIPDSLDKNNQEIIIVYLPQYLEYLGFVILLCLILIVGWWTLISKYKPKGYR